MSISQYVKDRWSAERAAIILGIVETLGRIWMVPSKSLHEFNEYENDNYKYLVAEYDNCFLYYQDVVNLAQKIFHILNNHPLQHPCFSWNDHTLLVENKNNFYDCVKILEKMNDDYDEKSKKMRL